MPRPLRIQFPGAIYHLMNRGDRRLPIFKDDFDRRRFLETLGEACAKTSWQIHAYCLMGNHFHLVLETPLANLVAGVKWFLGAYTSRFNRRHKLFGHLFSGRYKALLVDGSGHGYLRTVCDYVHLNPVRAKLLKDEQPLRAYPWSSYGLYLQTPAKRPAWLGVGRHHGGPERQETAASRAERLLAEELKRRGWSADALASRRKGDKEKVRIARRLRSETTMTLDWIAQRLNMGAAGYAAHCLRQARTGKHANLRD